MTALVSGASSTSLLPSLSLLSLSRDLPRSLLFTLLTVTGLGLSRSEEGRGGDEVREGCRAGKGVYLEDSREVLVLQ